jgi:integration host factor subunit alpha
LTREDLAEAIAEAHGLSWQWSRHIVDEIIAQMNGAFERGENVKIAGFGIFEIRERPERMGRDPKTMQPYPIAARKVLRFRASEKMRARIAGAGLPETD